MRRSKIHQAVLAFTFMIGTLFILSGCGSGGGGTATVPAGFGAGAGMISGTAAKGPVSGGTVRAYRITGGSIGSELGSAITDGTGNFAISIGAYSGPVMLQLTGGTYTDEATGTTMSMSPGDVMTAVIPSVASGETVTGVQVTPLTSMAQTMAGNMAGGMTGANITAANASMGGYFMVNDILHTEPMNPLVSGSSTTATQDMKNYGMSIAAMSQSAKDMGMASSSSMVTAMMQDASDGVMNGMMGVTQITMGGMGGGMMGGGGMMQSTAGTSGLATAMTTFLGSAMNRSGVTATDMQTLINQLNTTNGAI